MPSHDAIFKQFLGDIDIARDFLSIHLPPEIRQHCDFTTLQRESASFVDEELRSRVSDMLYSCRTTQGKGYIYCVIEHQSTLDRLMAFRLLRYCLAAMEQHLSQGHKTLPLVVPLLFYHGDRRPYPYSLNWLESFHDPLLARDIGVLMELWALPLTQQRALMFYIAHVGRTSDYRAFIDGVTEPLTGEREENMETIAKQLKRAGFEEGLLQGKEKWLAEGLEQGMKTSALRIARQMLKSGMPSQQVQQMTGLSDEDMQTAMPAEK
ncbi:MULTISPECIES: Rpn family recombination-promoting nuclease/putative transposase [Brenneria]|uniref:Rpn family recombination-promoting nuclease/putative transposase n=1 Tax=Brenneria nigrifluens DSM 30175 = ATCC 13028 TaxID=1121120 RepID=A0A2U1UUP4_9GAMM|nr:MULTISPECIES: Rpn family recombination-promoting nuclease/putative transposase [Brenneria]EHD22009.1 Conserved hypothetical protein CHP01784 [Brenneria sp. EniD312]PWC25342.1 Rpn family recombination-promoting nuclease/putative transposase [Brenneria nigrifluens DSM 30175 = ATCC 13028]QCR05093.1 Rpn family recombination-promoting nuclease/putative transposase [Brenneria nigrifluens DSM 30175 = ATCC 13028]